MGPFQRLSIFLAAFLVLLGMVRLPQAEAGSSLPSPKIDESSPAKGQETIVLAGGCFWGVQAVFEHVRGVTRATAGYSGGTLRNPSYEQVSSGTTGHAESVEIV